MPFHVYGKTQKFPRNEFVDIHVREVTLNADAPPEQQSRCIEIREFLREGEVYAHGLVLPETAVVDLCAAFNRLGLFEKRGRSVGDRR